MMSFRRFAFLAIAAGAALCGASRPAEAALSLTLSQTGFSSVTIPDNGSVTVNSVTYTDIDPTTGVISLSANFGTFTEVAVTIRSNSPGNPNPLVGGTLRDITAVARNTATGSAPLNISASGDGFTIPAGGSLAMRSSLSSDTIIGGNLTPGDTAQGVFISQLTSGVTTTSPAITITAAMVPSVGTTFGDANITSAARLLPTFTLSNTLAITLGGGGLANFTGQTQALVPEPATLALAASGLPLLALGLRRRRRAAA